MMMIDDEGRIDLWGNETCEGDKFEKNEKTERILILAYHWRNSTTCSKYNLSRVINIQGTFEVNVKVTNSARDNVESQDAYITSWKNAWYI